MSTSNFNEGNGQLIAAFENTSQSSSSSVTHSGMIHLPRGATSIPIVDGHLALHGIPSRQSFTGRSDISSADGESMGTLDGNSSSSSTSIKSKSSSLWDIQSDESRAGSDNTSHSASTGDNSNSSQIAIGKDSSSSSSSSSSSRSKKKYIPDKKDDMYSAGDITQNKRPRGTVGPSFSIDETSNSINISNSSDPRISSVKSPARLGQIAIAVVLASIRVRVNHPKILF